MAEVYTAEIDLRTYMERYRDASFFMGLCRQCRNYGSMWACPPFDFDVEARLGQFENVLIAAYRCPLPDGNHFVDEAMALLRPDKEELANRLLELEDEVGGLACGFGGKCPHCRKCARLKGEKCLHPDKVRPAVEAYGFDVGKTVSELLGIDIEWAKDGRLPKTLTLMAALFHNQPQGTISFK